LFQQARPRANCCRQCDPRVPTSTMTPSSMPPQLLPARPCRLCIPNPLARRSSERPRYGYGSSLITLQRVLSAFRRRCHGCQWIQSIADVAPHRRLEDDLGDRHGVVVYTATTVHFASLLEAVMKQPEIEDEDDILEDTLPLRLSTVRSSVSSTLKHPATEVVSPAPKRVRTTNTSLDPNNKRPNAHRHAKRAEVRRSNVASPRTERQTIVQAVPFSTNISMDDRRVPHVSWTTNHSL
ncbi:hypothetical protein H0H93_006385, partial [Arthromyces matolae]